jgi:hypothetical protein
MRVPLFRCFLVDAAAADELALSEAEWAFVAANRVRAEAISGSCSTLGL